MTDSSGLSRRGFLQAGMMAGAGALAASALAGCARAPRRPRIPKPHPARRTPTGSARSPAVDDADIVATRDTDFLIIGAGNAGMMAAGTASDLGLDFIVAEKGTSVGDTREYIGAINSKYSLDVAEPVDEMKLLNELTRYASGRVDQRVIKMWLNEGAEMIEWITPIMEANGKTLGVTPMEADHPAGGHLLLRPTTEHFYNPTYEYPMRNDILEWHIQEAGHEIDYNYDLVKLDHEGNRVTGAVFNTPEGLVRVNAAKGTLLATGGYAAEPRDDSREPAARAGLLHGGQLLAALRRLRSARGPLGRWREGRQRRAGDLRPRSGARGRGLRLCG